MDIQHHPNPAKQQAIKPFEELYESDGDLVQQLVTVINSLFSPLTWILEETLYRRIKKQDKGWIDVDYLNRNPKIINIFKDNGIPFQTRRKHNLLVRAIKRSILKKKKSFIKRKVHMNVNQEMKKVIYFESKTIKLAPKANQASQMQVQHSSFALTQTNLTSILESVISTIYQNKKQNSIDEQRMQMDPSKGNFNGELILNDIEFYGTFWSDFKEREINSNIDHSNGSQKSSKKEQYRWCFAYVPQISLQIAEQIQKRLKQTFSVQNCKQKTSNNESTEYSVQTYSLKEMVETFCPKYDEICKEIGYQKKDQHQEWLKMKNKQKQRQKIRLLESVDLDKKIDVQNQYHLKLKIQKLRKGYFKEKQAEYERKMRMRELKKSTKTQFEMQDMELKKDILTQKLKTLLGLKKQETHKQLPQTYQNLNKYEKKEEINDQQQQNQQDGSKIQIKLPKYAENQSQEISVDQMNEENEVYESFFEDQEEQQSSQSSNEEYQVPKKKNSKKNLPKKKKIVKNLEKSVNQVKSESKEISTSKQSQKQKRVSENGQKSSKSISNTTYNLRHKTHSQGSYLKMVETIEDEASLIPTQKPKNDKFFKKFQNLIDEHHSISNSRSLRSKKRQNDKLN